MAPERSSEDNDGRQVRATIGRAAGYALQCRSVRHHEAVSGSFGTEDVDRCGRRWVCQRCQGFIRHQRSRPERWALRPASFAPKFRGLSEGFIDFEASAAAAAGSRHCPPTAALRDRIRRHGLLLPFAQAGYVRAEPAISRPSRFLDLSDEDRAIPPDG
jgi:hypothetical protein